jgi:uncharacterized protein YkwD
MDNLKNILPQHLWKLALALGGISFIILIWRGNLDSAAPVPIPTPEVELIQRPTLAIPITQSVSELTRLLPTATPTLQPPTLTPTPIPVYYIVEPGDVALAIAAKYGLNVDVLLEVNGITDPTTLQIGQQLLIPVTVTPTPTATPTPQFSPTPTPSPVYHVVESGDTLLAMADQYDTTVETIMVANDLVDPHALRIGQALLIPPKGASFDPPTVIHVIEPGDTLLALAIRYGSTLDDILTANPDLEPTTVLQIGQKIIVPVTQATVSLPTNPGLPRVIYPEASSPGLVELEQLIIAATNAQRQAQGLEPYTADEQLGLVARAHAQDMSARGYFSHASPEGKRVRDRLQEHELNLNWVGENILRSTRSAGETPEYTINWFMADRPHRLNLLHDRYNSIGVGVAQEATGWYIIVQVFAER